jgi:hypothetical protein
MGQSALATQVPDTHVWLPTQSASDEQGGTTQSPESQIRPASQSVSDEQGGTTHSPEMHSSPAPVQSAVELQPHDCG